MRFLKVGGVILFASVLSTLGIMASDLVQHENSLLGQLISSEQAGPCPAGMAHVPSGQTYTCVDTYEVSPSQECAHADISSTIVTQDNISQASCAAVSDQERTPWTFVTREQAAQLCARSGKRLPTAKEWYQIALDTPTGNDVCNVNTGRIMTGAESQCVSAVGAVNMVGNVWEWVSDDVIEGVYNGRTLPDEGYVSQVDAAGVVTVSAATPAKLFQSDYAWTTNQGVYGMLRGGYFDSGADGGLYAVHMETAPTAATVAIGFRCVL